MNTRIVFERILLHNINLFLCPPQKVVFIFYTKKWYPSTAEEIVFLISQICMLEENFFFWKGRHTKGSLKISICSFKKQLFDKYFWAPSLLSTFQDLGVSVNEGEPFSLLVKSLQFEVEKIFYIK